MYCCREIARPVIAQKLEQPYVNNEKDTYLALEVLAAILEKLSESGRSIHVNHAFHKVVNFVSNFLNFGWWQFRACRTLWNILCIPQYEILLVLLI